MSTSRRAAASGARADPRSPGSGQAGPHRSAGQGLHPDDTSGPGTRRETVVLAVGMPYFNDGRVGPERYVSDLAPTMLGSVTAAHLLLKGLFEEMGAPRGEAIEASCSRWRLLFGAEPGQAQMTEDGAGDANPEAAVGAKRPGADQWVRGLVASRDSDHAEAMAAFEEEAQAAVQTGAPQRAAIAYRSAAAAARAAGRADSANRMIRLAGKSYLEIAERPDTIPQGVFMAYREGARCFLEAGNLPLAHTCLTKAIAIGETLGYME